MKIKTILMSFMLTLLLGCSAVKFAEERPATTRLLLQYATMKIIEESSNPFGRAARTVEVVDAFTDYVRTSNLDGDVTIDELLMIGRTFINWEEMPLADQLLVEALLEEIRIGFQKKVSEQVITEGDRIHIYAALQVVRDTAVRMSTKAE